MRIFYKHPKRYPTFLCTENRVYFALADTAGKSFVKYLEKPLAPKSIINGEVINHVALGQVIQSIVTESRLTEKEVVVGVSEVKATTRSIVLPELKSEEIHQAVEQQAPSFLPFPYHDEYLDWKVIDKNKEGKEKILISAIPKTVIDGYCSVFQKAGLRPVAFESTSLSLFRLLPDEAKKSSIAIEIGEVNTLLILGFEGSIEASSVIQETAGIEDKIEKLINYYSSKRTGGVVPDTVYICGKSATPEIGQKLNQQLHLKPVFLQADMVNIQPQQKLELAVLSSLAKKVVHAPMDPETINVLPENLAREYTAQEKQAGTKTTVSIQIALLLLIIGSAGYFYRTVRNERIALQQENSSAVEVSPLVADPGKTAIVISSDEHVSAVRTAVDIVLSTKADGITVNGISYTQEQTETLISGTAQSRDHLLAFQEILKKTGVFSDVIIPLSSLEEETDVTFRIKVLSK